MSQCIPTYLETGDVADSLGVHPITLRRWIDAGRVEPSARTRRGYLFSQDAADALRAEISGAAS